MLGLKKHTATRSAIGADMTVTGPCSFQDSLQIDGQVHGDVQATPGGNGPSLLIIGETGQVQGAISADQIIIAGQVLGPVLARESLELHARARVEGDVRYKSLEMHPGAVIAGQLEPQLTPQVGLSTQPPETEGFPPTEMTEPTLEPAVPGKPE